MKVIIVGSGGGGGFLDMVLFGSKGSWEEREPGEASFLCVRSLVVKVCWMCETLVKGVVLGRWRWASRIFGCCFWFWLSASIGFQLLGCDWGFKLRFQGGIESAHEVAFSEE